MVTIQSLIDKYSPESIYEYSILNSRLFKESRDALEGKTCVLREKRFGKKANKANSLTRQEDGQVTKHLKVLYLLFGGSSLNILGCGRDKHSIP